MAGALLVSKQYTRCELQLMNNETQLGHTAQHGVWEQISPVAKSAAFPEEAISVFSACVSQRNLELKLHLAGANYV
jgi:hypothetical protein